MSQPEPDLNPGIFESPPLTSDTPVPQVDEVSYDKNHLERGIQIAVLEMLNPEFGRKQPDCIQGIESAAIASQRADSRAGALEVVLAALDMRIKKIRDYKKRWEKRKEAREVLKPKHVQRLALLPEICQGLERLRDCLKVLFELREWDENELRAARRIQAAAMEKLLTYQFVSDPVSHVSDVSRVSHKVCFDPLTNRTFAGALTEKQLPEYLEELYLRQCTLRCLSPEETKQVFIERLGYDEESAESARVDVSKRINRYLRESLESLDQTGLNFPISFLDNMTLVTAQDRSKLRTKPNKEGAMYIRNLFRVYMNMLLALPNPDSLQIPLWDAARMREIEYPCITNFKLWNINFREPGPIIKKFTKGTPSAAFPTIKYEHVGGRERRGSDRRKYSREWWRIMRTCGLILVKLNADDLHEELARYCEAEDITLPEAINRFTGKAEKTVPA